LTLARLRRASDSPASQDSQRPQKYLKKGSGKKFLKNVYFAFFVISESYPVLPARVAGELASKNIARNLP